MSPCEHTHTLEQVEYMLFDWPGASKLKEFPPAGPAAATLRLLRRCRVDTAATSSAPGTGWNGRKRRLRSLI